MRGLHEGVASRHCAADASTGFPHPKHLMRFAYEGLDRSFDTGIITMQQFDPSQALPA